MSTRRRRSKPDAEAGPSGAKKNARSRKASKQERTTEKPIEASPAETRPIPDAQQKPAPHVLFSAPIAVRWRDLDAFNHVNNSNFLTYLEEARLRWLKDVPGPWFDAHSMPLLAAAELNYRAPIEWPAAIVVELSCERLGNSSITIGHRIVDAKAPQKLYCDGRTVLVWADPTTGRPVPLPEAIRSAAM
ncbi:MAG TPA: thioesterase family protein [Rhodanobacteraceae bacterium]|nr:thioesterase family protein [Rhodanobacteraceae bacterium]